MSMSIISHVSVGASPETMTEMLALYDAIAEALGAKRHMVICKKEQPESGSSKNESKDSSLPCCKDAEGEVIHVPKQDLYKVGTVAAQQQDGSSPIVLAVAYGKYYPEFWVGLPLDTSTPASAGNGTHVAFACSSKNMVDQVYNVAIAKGAKCNGPPGPRPAYSAQYYGGFFIDPCGNKMEATFFDMGIFNYCTIM
jgi:uncharacterized glyoxalase superfamily protein PhnB